MKIKMNSSFIFVIHQCCHHQKISSFWNWSLSDWLIFEISSLTNFLKFHQKWWNLPSNYHIWLIDDFFHLSSRDGKDGISVIRWIWWHFSSPSQKDELIAKIHLMTNSSSGALFPSFMTNFSSCHLFVPITGLYYYFH